MRNKILSNEWAEGIPRDTSRAKVFGTALLLFTFFGFVFWGNAAPIAGAIVTSGVFVAGSENKIIQHLEGGVIEEIHVSEGYKVNAGDTLVTLDQTIAEAELRRLQLRHARLRAISYRLEAEMADTKQLNFPDELLQKAQSDPDIQEIIDAQSLTFEAKQETLFAEIEVLQSSQQGFEERITGSQTQLEAAREQLRLIEGELADKEGLVKRGLVRRSEVIILERTRANLQGEIGRLIGEIGDTKEKVARVQAQVIGMKSRARKTAVEEYQEMRAEMDDIEERMTQAGNVLQRIEIKAPVSGIVVKMRYHTPGGVIEPGKNVMEIVPATDSLVIEANIRPQDIDSVRIGQEAGIRLTALNQRTTPMVTGSVIYVSADALQDEKSTTPNDIYIARIALDDVGEYGVEEFTPTPGMPAEIYIKTSERTFFSYLMQPIRDSMSRAFREN